jgi:hypothetical protein
VYGIVYGTTVLAMEELKNISIEKFSTSFDLSAYIIRYPVVSEARVQRLRFLAEKDPVV